MVVLDTINEKEYKGNRTNKKELVELMKDNGWRYDVVYDDVICVETMGTRQKIMVIK